MSEPITYPPVVLEPPDLPQSKWDQEKQSFRRLLPGLLNTHRGKYAAVHEGQVVDTDDDKIALAWRVYEKLGYTPVYVGLVAEQPPPPIRIPSFRVVQR